MVGSLPENLSIAIGFENAEIHFMDKFKNNYIAFVFSLSKDHSN